PDNFDLRRLALPAFGPSLMFRLCEGAILPVLALSARAPGASSAVAGLIVALLGLASLLANLPAAQLTPRLGEPRAMVGASAFGPPLMLGLWQGAILPGLALSARALGASSAVAGLSVALVGRGSLLASLPAAQLTTRFGERRAMIGASVFALLALLLCIAARS